MCCLLIIRTFLAVRLKRVKINYELEIYSRAQLGRIYEGTRGLHLAQYLIRVSLKIITLYKLIISDTYDYAAHYYIIYICNNYMREMKYKQI